MVRLKLIYIFLIYVNYLSLYEIFEKLYFVELKFDFLDVLYSVFNLQTSIWCQFFQLWNCDYLKMIDTPLFIEFFIDSMDFWLGLFWTKLIDLDHESNLTSKKVWVWVIFDITHGFRLYLDYEHNLISKDLVLVIRLSPILYVDLDLF